MGGSNSGGQPAAYGTLGVYAPGNIPGSRGQAVSWTDSSGRLWLFGGVNNNGPLNDLWQFDPPTNEWAWMGGSSTAGQSGVYGTLGVPAPGNVPGARFSSVSWTDSNGHFWLFGGSGPDANGTGGDLNELWEFDPSTNEWAWMGGSSTVPGPSAGQPGVYGTLGVPAPGNIPGARIYPTGWTDRNGFLWLFGGQSDIWGNFNDLWKFDPSTNEWAWMGGSTGPGWPGPSGVYGTIGVPAPGNTPGGRYGASSWTDSNGHLWLFGGNKFVGDSDDDLNDLWQFNPSTTEWAWMGGSNSGGQPGVYGTLGALAAGNNPGSRLLALSWTDNSGNLWLFGGGGLDANGTPGNLNDLWQFNPSANEWAWMGGSSSANQPGVYGTLGTPAPGNIPGGRGRGAYWTDSGGHLWLFSGRAENDLWEYWPAAVLPTPVITWPAPAAITYGTALSATQPDATTTVAGTFEYSPAVGTVLHAGIQTLSVTFTPADTTHYATTKAAVTLTVNPVTPVIAWPTPAAITYPTALSATQLDATTTISGTFTYRPPAGTMLVPGTQTLRVTFTPADPTDYTAATASITLVVNPGSVAVPFGEWAWMSGGNWLPYYSDCCTVGWSGVYGTLGTPDPANVPGSRTDAMGWTDSSDHLWLFGGFGFDVNGGMGPLNDLWEFDLATNEWVWMGGSNSGWQHGVYGTLGVPAAGNIPGARFDAATWTDSKGHLWMFGGFGDDANGSGGFLNDVWEFDASTNEWAWMGGSSTGNHLGHYGTLGVPAVGNIPGNRSGALGWTDRDGHLWLFGGASADASVHNDLWEFDPSTNEWAWMGGSSSANQPGVYGTLGVPAAGNIPGSCTGAIGSTDSSGHLWLYRGNELWKFNPSTNEWAWMGSGSQQAVYGTLGTAATGNSPGSRSASVSWTDSSGNFWLFGGPGPRDDLWEFDSSSNKWAWMGGSNSTSGCDPGYCWLHGVYGTLGTPALGNIPEPRFSAVRWTDNSGHFWLFGGSTNGGYLNDLWEFLPPAPPAITFTPLTSPVVYGVPPMHLQATSASGHRVHFRVVSGPGFVHHRRLTITGAGTIVVAAYLEGGPEVTQSIVVNKATPTIRLKSWPHSIAAGQTITFTARLRADCNKADRDNDDRDDAECDRPTGKVVFFDGQTPLGERRVRHHGEAEFTTDSLGAGTHNIKAVYGGDQNYTGASSTPVDITVH
jgi:N-acetylneuraminic acid mutarotase